MRLVLRRKRATRSKPHPEPRVPNGSQLKHAMTPNALSKIRVEAGSISLTCRKGTARVSTQLTPRSNLADYTATLDTIVELAKLAAPEVPTIEFAFGDDEPTELEFDAATAMARLAGLRRAVWTSRSSPHASVVEQASREGAVPGPGWQLFGATKSGLARIEVADGDLTVEWKGAKQTCALAAHSRLLFPSLEALEKLLLGAKRNLALPNGARFEIVLPEAASELERTAIRESVVSAFRSFGQADKAAKRDELGWASFAVSGVACAVYVITSRFFGHDASPVALAFILIGGSITYGFVEAWLKDRAKIAKLRRLLQPR